MSNHQGSPNCFFSSRRCSFVVCFSLYSKRPYIEQSFPFRPASGKQGKSARGALKKCSRLTGWKRVGESLARNPRDTGLLHRCQCAERRAAETMASPGTLLTLVVVLLSVVALSPVAGKRKQPPPPLVVVQALKPTGLRISVADEEGMDLVIINANINVPLQPTETGQLSKNIVRSKEDLWTLEDLSQQLKEDDVIFYRITASSKEGRRSYEGHYIISDFADPSCKPSVTTVNGRQACKGALVFEDNFDRLNRTTWKHQNKIYFTFFNMFVPDEENSFAQDGTLFLKATAVRDQAQLTTPLKLEGCTSPWDSECERKPFAWQINPPVRSAWLSTTSSFRFGRFEVRAKIAAGDWLYSGIFLYPQSSEYGGDLSSGEIVVMRGRGNEDLRNGEDDHYNFGANEIHANTGVRTCNQSSFDAGEKSLPKGLYSETFHTYAVTWTPRQIKFEVDGEVFKVISPPLPDGFLGTAAHRDCEHSPWEKGSFMAPFDKEFTLNLNLNAGGLYMFPDGTKSGKHDKPWQNDSPKAVLNFWQDRNEWLPTWKEGFVVDYAKVWAL